jgi:hypothetical protein
MPALEQLEITAHGFLASQLTEHIREMDDSSLVVEDCPVARTGFQTYAVRDLPQESARELGIDLNNPHASIDLYRPSSEVFKPEFLASLEGRAVTDGHPQGFVKPENFRELAMGHVQNVRKGEQMEDGEWPIIADVVISAEPLVSKVRNKTARDISLGYDFAIRKDGKKIIQCDMIANHCAVVPSGRAGGLIAIGDAAPEANESPPQSVEPPSIVAPVAKALNQTDTPTKKERKPVKSNIMHLLGLGLRARAADAETDPEELAQAAMDVGKFQEPVAEDRKPKGKDAKSKDGESPDDPEEDDEADVEDRKPRAKDRKPAKDAHRQRMHDALDDLLDKEDDGESAEATDADLEELKNLLGQFFSEEEAEPQHEAADIEEPDTAELDGVLEGEPVADGTIEEEQLPEEVQDAPEPAVEEEDPDGEEDLEPVSDKGKAKDRARAADGAAAVLKTLRKSIAHCNDADVQRAFNAALGSVTRASKAGTGSHAAFSTAARARDGAPRTPVARVRAMDQADPGRITKLQDAYNTAHKGGK